MLKNILPLIFICILGQTALAQNIFDIIDDSPSANGKQQSNIGQEITDVIKGGDLKFAPTDEINVPEEQLYEHIKAPELQLKASGMPESVYVGQVFSMKLTANTQSDLNLKFETSIENPNLSWLNQKGLKWTHIGNGLYSSTLYFQANSSNIKSFQLKLKVLANQEIFQQKSISIFLPQIKAVDFEKTRYSHIVADDLQANSFRLKKFDDEHNIIMIELKGSNVNLRNFHINNPDIKRQDIDTITGDFKEQSAYYFAIIKSGIKNFSFSYYNLKQNRIKIIERVGLKLENDEVSTQVGLNPQEGYFEIYKNITIFALAGLFLILSVWRKKLIYIIGLIFFVFLGAYAYNPLNIVVLKADTQVRILPISSSTPFYEQTGRVQKGVKILDSAKDYYKIKFNKDGVSQVGWVKRDDVTKN